MSLTTAKTGSWIVPECILAGVYDAAAKHLGIANISHRSAGINVQAGDALSLFAAVHNAVCRNYVTSNATARKDWSSQNWRWHSPQPQISAHNTSGEVVLERAITAAAVALEDLVELILFLASPRATAVHGACFTADRGITAG